MRYMLMRSLGGALAPIALSMVLGAIIPIVAFFVVRADEKRLGRSLNSGRDALVYYMANIFLYGVYLGLTMMGSQFLLLAENSWWVFRFGFVLTGVSTVFLVIVAVLRSRLEGRDALSSLKDLAFSKSPYLKLYSGVNVATGLLSMAVMVTGSGYLFLEMLFQDHMTFEAVSKPLRVGMVVFVTTTAMVLLNYFIFASCPKRDVDWKYYFSPNGQTGHDEGRGGTQQGGHRGGGQKRGGGQQGGGGPQGGGGFA